MDIGFGDQRYGISIENDCIVSHHHETIEILRGLLVRLYDEGGRGSNPQSRATAD